MPVGLLRRISTGLRGPPVPLGRSTSARVPAGVPFSSRPYIDRDDDVTDDTFHGLDLETESDMPKAAFYAVSAGRKPGIYHTWAEAEAQVKGFAKARFKKFPSMREAEGFMGQGSGRPYEPGSRANSASATGSGSSSQTTTPSRRCAPGKTRTGEPSTRADSAKNGKSRAESPPTSADPSVLPPEIARLADKGYTFSRATPHRLVVYTDGSGIGNGKQGAVAGAGVFWGGTGEAYKNNLAERVPGPLQTNNRGELLSIIRALEACPYPDLPLEVRTDSQYSISCMTVYIHKWIRNGWRTTGSKQEGVKNADMIRHLLVLLRRRGPSASVRFKYVRGHAGHEGNEAADKLARLGAMSPPLPDREDWLSPDNETEDEGRQPAAAPVPDLEVDPEWLMDESELAELEDELEDDTQRS